MIHSLLLYKHCPARVFFLGKGSFYIAQSSPLDRSKRFTLFAFLAELFIPTPFSASPGRKHSSPSGKWLPALCACTMVSCVKR